MPEDFPSSQLSIPTTTTTFTHCSGACRRKDDPMADRAELVKKLNDEGDFGADYIEELLNIADLDGDIEIGVEADRAAAIRYAVERAAVNDIILIAGKGHENYQDMQGVKHHFSDFEVAEKALAEWI